MSILYYSKYFYYYFFPENAQVLLCVTNSVQLLNNATINQPDAHVINWACENANKLYTYADVYYWIPIVYDCIHFDIAQVLQIETNK